MLKVKICGLSNKTDVESSIKYGASFCGFILNWKKSHRYINFSTAQHLTKIKKNKCKFVGVLVDPSDQEVKRFSKLNFDYFQLHGSEDFRRVMEIKKISSKKIIKTIKIKNKNDLSTYKEYIKNIDIILFDSMGFEKSLAFNHSLLKHLEKKDNKWMIAGNIQIQDLENISKIADYVDVSGSVETKKKKDRNKIKNFLLKAKEIND